MKKITLSIIAIAMIGIFSSTNCVAQENKKVDKAVTHLCEALNKFAGALVKLDQLNEDASYKEFKEAYNHAVKDWNHVVTEADKLENVEIKQSVKAYNSLVDSVNNVKGEEPTDKESANINKNIDNTASTIADILTESCS